MAEVMQGVRQAARTTRESMKQCPDIRAAAGGRIRWSD